MGENSNHSTADHDAERQRSRPDHARQIQDVAKQASLETPTPSGLLADSVNAQSAEQHAALLGDARMSHPANSAQRAQIVSGLQRTHGNAYVQRLLTSQSVQAKLTVNPPGDQYEQEADRMADQVAQRISASGNDSAQRQPEEEEEELQTKLQRQPEEEEEELQAKHNTANTVPTVDSEMEARINSARRGGESLPDDIRGQMEQGFGTDFSGVRVHSDSDSDGLNQSLQARAFTTGQDIFFGSGEYNPGTSAGKQLVAHELTHTIQQGASNSQTRPAAGTKPHSPGAMVQRALPTQQQWLLSSKGSDTTPRSDEMKAIDAEVLTWLGVKDKSYVKRVAQLTKLLEVIKAWELVKVGEPGRESAVTGLKTKVEAEQTTLKTSIPLHIKNTYGIDLDQNAGVTAVKTTYSAAPTSVKNGLVKQAWTLEELADLAKALSNYAGLLGPERTKRIAKNTNLGAQPLTSFSRLKQGIDVPSSSGQLDNSTAGETFSGSKNITMFDVGTKVTDFVTDKANPTDAEYRMGFRGTIEHELSHALIEKYKGAGTGAKTMIAKFVTAMDFWTAKTVSPYWRSTTPKSPATTPATYEPKNYGQTGYSAANTKSAAAAASPAVETPITNYGMKTAGEDLAETMMFYFENPTKLQTDCPKRHEFVENNIKSLLGPAPTT